MKSYAFWQRQGPHQVAVRAPFSLYAHPYKHNSQPFILCVNIGLSSAAMPASSDLRSHFTGPAGVVRITIYRPFSVIASFCIGITGPFFTGAHFLFSEQPNPLVNETHSPIMTWMYSRDGQKQVSQNHTIKKLTTAFRPLSPFLLYASHRFAYHLFIHSTASSATNPTVQQVQNLESPRTIPGRTKTPPRSLKMGENWSIHQSNGNGRNRKNVVYRTYIRQGKGSSRQINAQQTTSPNAYSWNPASMP